MLRHLVPWDLLQVQSCCLRGLHLFNLYTLLFSLQRISVRFVVTRITFTGCLPDNIPLRPVEFHTYRRLFLYDLSPNRG